MYWQGFAKFSIQNCDFWASADAGSFLGNSFVGKIPTA
jgi:hypothetical protein